METLALYLRLVGAQVRGQMQYKVSFLLALVGTFLTTAADFGVVLVLFGRVSALAGWSLPEVALLYGLAATSFAVAEMFSASLDNFQVFVLRGTFDRVLTRPRGALFQVLVEDFGPRRLGRVAQGVVGLGLALAWLDLRWSPDRVLVLAVGLAAGTAIYFALFVLGGAFCFWSTQGKEATHVVTYGGEALATYPLDIYHAWVRHVFTFLVPLAFVAYQPALYLLDRPDPLGLPPAARLLSPAVAVVMAGVAAVGWRLGVRRYQSTGT